LEIAAVAADAGLGKTRLLIEFESRLQDLTGRSAPRIAYGRALAANSVGNGFQPLREAVADLLVEEERRGRERLKRLGSLLRATAPDWLDALPVVGGVLHAAAVTTQHILTPDAGTTDSMNAQFLALLERITDDRPLVLLLDDLHWADQSSIDLLFFLSQRVRKPVLMVLAFRVLDLRGGQRHHPLRQTLWRIERYSRVHNIELGPLSMESLARLAEQTLGSAPDPALVAWLARMSEGNPLYVQEYLWHLQDLRGDGADWSSTLNRLASDGRVELPRTLEAVIAERLDDLNYEALRVLQLASIVGPVFATEDLLVLSDMGAEPTKRALRFLCQRIGLVRATADGDGYTFYHGLVREYVKQHHQRDDPLDYREINKLRANYLAERADRGLDLTQTAAYHYHESGADEEALIFALEAAAAAKAIGATSEAVQYLTWAVEHADRGRFRHESVTARRDLGALQQELIRTDDAVDTLETAIGGAPQAGLSRLEEFDLLVELARAYRMEELWDQARSYLERASALEAVADPDRRAYLRLIAAEVQLSGSPRSLPAAEELLRQAEELATLRRHLASIYGHRGFVALARDQVAESWDWFERAHRMAEQGDSIGRLYETHLWREKHHLACLRLTAAGGELDAMADLARRLGVGQTVAHHCRDAGRRHALAGEQGAAALAYASYLSHMLDNQAWTSRALMYLVLQTQEILDELGPPEAADFLSRLHECLTGSSQLQVFAVATRELQEAVAGGKSPAAGIRDAALQALLHTEQARSTDLIFRFHIDDLTAFRRRHGFVRS
jgi:tetratricopeptide (TPR) repeat protein